MSTQAFWSFADFVVGFIVLAILMYKNKGVSARLLAFSLFTLTYSSLIIFFWETQQILSVPHLSRTAPLMLYLTPPSLYLYVTFELKRHRRFHWTDLIHLAPVVLYFIDYLPFFLSNAQDKKETITILMSQPLRMLSFDEGWLFPSGFHTPARRVITLIYAVAQLKFVLNFRQTDKGSGAATSLVSWLLNLTLLNLVCSIVGFLWLLLLPPQVQWFISCLNITIILFVICVILLFKPDILYGTSVKHRRALNGGSRPQSLSPEMIFELQTKFHSFIHEQTYLSRDINIKEVADSLKTQPYILSSFINRIYGMHFNDLINQYRIDYVKDGMASKKWDLITLEAIAEEAGFNNRTTFLNAFKKFTGMTPTQFIKQTASKSNTL